MKFTIQREKILKPLQLVSGAVERRQTLPILSNILLSVQNDQLILTGTDLEVELKGTAEPDEIVETGEVTVSARKLMDICRSLPNEAAIEIYTEKNWLFLVSNKSRFTLSTLPAEEFPNVEEEENIQAKFAIGQSELRALMTNTHFSMAQQDVRYYLNGMLFDIDKGILRLIATDGHRLSLGQMKALKVESDRLQVIVPRKGIIELMRLLDDEEHEVEIIIGTNHIRAQTPLFTFTSKLIEGKFPDYKRVVPKGGDKEVIVDKELLKQTLIRASILSNEKFKGVRLLLSSGNLKIFANNPEQERAEEEIAVHYQGADLEIGFNVSYLLDVCNAVTSKDIKMIFHNTNDSVLIENSDDDSYLYVIMPMRL